MRSTTAAAEKWRLDVARAPARQALAEARRDQLGEILGEARRRRRQEAGPVVDDDVARAAGVHRRDRDAEAARLEEHAAQRSGPCDGKTSAAACASQASVSCRASQPVKRTSIRSARASASSGARSGPSPTTISGHDSFAAIAAGNRWATPLFGASLPTKIAYGCGIRDGAALVRGALQGREIDRVRDRLDAASGERGRAATRSRPSSCSRRRWHRPGRACRPSTRGSRACRE